MKRRARTERDAGFTLLEMAVALVLFALVVLNVYTILAGSSTSIVDRSAEFEVEAQAQRALDRIALALVGSFEGSLHVTQLSPMSVSSINYEEFLGIGDLDGNGTPEQVYSPPMRISHAGDAAGSVEWLENPESDEQKRVVWVKDVPSIARGEIAGNGLDDNGNGIVDEKGLAFVKDGRSIRIFLTLRRRDAKGGFLEKELQTTVTCRN